MDASFDIIVNGISTHIHIWGEKEDNPILLFVHGGPGNPIRHKIKKHLLFLKKEFTLVCYDQRGCGDSFRPKLSVEEFHPDFYVSDIIEISQYLHQCFPLAKQILVGESFGTFIGSLAVQKRPDLFSAYVGYGQISDESAMLGEMVRSFSEKLKLLGKEKEATFWEKSLERMRKSPHGSPIFKRFFCTYYPLMEPSDMKPFYLREILPFNQTNEYSSEAKQHQRKHFGDVARWTRKNCESLSLTDRVNYPLPVYFFVGELDVVVPAGTQKAFFEQITATKKGLYSFPKAGHCVPFEDPEAFGLAIREVYQNL